MKFFSKDSPTTDVNRVTNAPRMSLHENPPAPTSVAPDDILLQRVQDGDDEAFGQIFHRYYPLVRNFSCRYLLGQVAGEDVAQETFVRLARQLPSCAAGATLRPWLLRVATNLCRDYLRAESTRRRKLAAYEEENTSAPSSHEPAHRVREALGALPPDQRAAVVLVYYEDLTHAEAAHSLGCAETTISWRLMLARKKLKTLLQT
jgi:RNA polymerase sigma-70 factor (ECF subfamily)